MPTERRALFGAALFFTVLVDQVCFTHFPAAYAEFNSLTRYPKLRGDCPGACDHHIHPVAIFEELGRHVSAAGNVDQFAYELLPPDTIAAMRREVTDFVQTNMPQLGDSFWACCDREIPIAMRAGIRGLGQIDPAV
jgi:hypothetical protein